MANQLQQLQQNEYDEGFLIPDLLGLGSQIQSDIINGQDPSTSIGTYSKDLNFLNQISLDSATLNSDLQVELQGQNFDLGMSISDIQNYVSSVLTNGFPDSELSLMADLGLDPSAIKGLLSGVDFSTAPTSLGGLLTFNASIQNQLAAVTNPVPEPPTISLLLIALAGFAAWSRVRINYL